MKNVVLSLLAIALVFAACKKNKTTIVPVDAGLKSSFNYKTGSYWIYKDSISGAIDSIYVTANQTEYYLAGGCVIERNAPEIESIIISLSFAETNSTDTEKWTYRMDGDKFYLGMYNNSDKVESRASFHLFTWPLAIGPAQNSGCVLNFDSGGVTDIIPQVSLSGQTFDNAARSAHSQSTYDTSMAYNDCFYVNQSAGIIKVVFDHPTLSVHRVLELQRYHIVK